MRESRSQRVNHGSRSTAIKLLYEYRTQNPGKPFPQNYQLPEGLSYEDIQEAERELQSGTVVFCIPVEAIENLSNLIANAMQAAMPEEERKKAQDDPLQNNQSWWDWGRQHMDVVTQKAQELFSRDLMPLRNSAPKGSNDHLYPDATGELRLTFNKGTNGGIDSFTVSTKRILKNGTEEPTKFTGVLSIERMGSDGKLLPGVVDIVTFKGGEVESVLLASDAKGKCRISNIAELIKAQSRAIADEGIVVAPAAASPAKAADAEEVKVQPPEVTREKGLIKAAQFMRAPVIRVDPVVQTKIPLAAPAPSAGVHPVSPAAHIPASVAHSTAPASLVARAPASSPILPASGTLHVPSAATPHISTLSPVASQTPDLALVRRSASGALTATTIEGMQQDLYDFLGVAHNALPREIKLAFNKRALELHPDKHPERAEEFKRLAAAFEVLRNPDSREQYDRELMLEDAEYGKIRTDAVPAISDQPLVPSGSVRVIAAKNKGVEALTQVRDRSKEAREASAQARKQENTKARHAKLAAKRELSSAKLAAAEANRRAEQEKRLRLKAQAKMSEQARTRHITSEAHARGEILNAQQDAFATLKSRFKEEGAAIERHLQDVQKRLVESTETPARAIIETGEASSLASLEAQRTAEAKAIQDRERLEAKHQAEIQAMKEYIARRKADHSKAEKAVRAEAEQSLAAARRDAEQKGAKAELLTLQLESLSDNLARSRKQEEELRLALRAEQLRREKPLQPTDKNAQTFLSALEQAHSPDQLAAVEKLAADVATQVGGDPYAFLANVEYIIQLKKAPATKIESLPKALQTAMARLDTFPGLRQQPNIAAVRAFFEDSDGLAAAKPEKLGAMLKQAELLINPEFTTTLAGAKLDAALGRKISDETIRALINALSVPKQPKDPAITIDAEASTIARLQAEIVAAEKRARIAESALVEARRTTQRDIHAAVKAARDVTKAAQEVLATQPAATAVIRTVSGDTPVGAKEELTARQTESVPQTLFSEEDAGRADLARQEAEVRTELFSKLAHGMARSGSKAIQDANARAQSIEAALKEAQALSDGWQRSVHILQKEKLALQTQASDADELRAARERLAQHARGVEEENARLTRALAEQRRQIDAEQIRLRKQTEQMEQTRQNLRETEHEKSEQEAQYKAKIAGKETELERLRSELRSAQGDATRATELQESVSKTEAYLQKSIEYGDKMQRELAKIRAEKDDLTQQLEESEEIIARLSQAGALTERLRAAHRELQLELLSKPSIEEHVAVVDHARAMEARAAQAEALAEERAVELQAAHTALENRKIEIVALEMANTVVKKLEKQFTTATQEKMDALVAAMTDLSDRTLKDATQKVAALQAQLQQSEAEVESLRSQAKEQDKEKTTQLLEAERTQNEQKTKYEAALQELHQKLQQAQSEAEVKASAAAEQVRAVEADIAEAKKKHPTQEIGIGTDTDLLDPQADRKKHQKAIAALDTRIRELEIEGDRERVKSRIVAEKHQKDIKEYLRRVEDLESTVEERDTNLQLLLAENAQLRGIEKTLREALQERRGITKVIETGRQPTSDDIWAAAALLQKAERSKAAPKDSTVSPGSSEGDRLDAGSVEPSSPTSQQGTARGMPGIRPQDHQAAIKAARNMGSTQIIQGMGTAEPQPPQYQKPKRPGQGRARLAE